MIKIDRKIIDLKSPTYLIGEIGINHNGKIKNVYKLIDLAKESGFDAVKFQTYKTELLIHKNNTAAKYQKTKGFKDQYSMLKKFEISFNNFEKIFNYCKKKKITFLSTPFDQESAFFLQDLNLSAYKISSGDLDNYHLVDLIKTFNKPIILSTGMTDRITLQRVIKDHGFNKKKLILLHCISDYPTILKETNLGYLQFFKKTGFVYGFSDHTTSNTAALSAISLGAKVIEKHITLSRNMHGPDHSCSLEAKNFKGFIEQIKNLEISLSQNKRLLSNNEIKNKEVTERKLFFRYNFKKNHKINFTDLLPMRSNYKMGIKANKYRILINKKLSKDVKKFQLIKWEILKK